MRNVNANHYIYTHWLKLDSNNEIEKWNNLKNYKEKYDCSMTVFYYDYNPLEDKVIKLDCNQSYSELDLDIDSKSEGSLKKIQNKPTNITQYNRTINSFFKEKLGVEIKEKSLFPNLKLEDLIEVDVLKEFKNLDNIDFFSSLLKRENWKVVKIKDNKVYKYQLYFGKGKQVGNRFEFAYSSFMYKSRMDDRLQRFINNYKANEEFDISKYVDHKINAFEDIYQFSTGEKIRTNVRCIGVVLGIEDNKVDFFDFKNPRTYQHYSINIKDFEKFIKEGSYKVNYNSFSNLEKMEMRKYELKKMEKFAELCGDWDYRKNIDMTEAHLQSIDIDEDSITINCEKYSTDLDDYIFCEAGNVIDKKLVHIFHALDLSKREDVLNFISKVEDHIDFNKVSDELYSKEQKELSNLDKEQEVELDYGE